MNADDAFYNWFAQLPVVIIVLVLVAAICGTVGGTVVAVRAYRKNQRWLVFYSTLFGLVAFLVLILLAVHYFAG